MDTLHDDEVFEVFKRSDIHTMNAIHQLNNRYKQLTESPRFTEVVRQSIEETKNGIRSNLNEKLMETIDTSIVSIRYLNPYTRKAIMLYGPLNGSYIRAERGGFMNMNREQMYNEIDYITKYINKIQIIYPMYQQFLNYRHWFNLAYDAFEHTHGNSHYYSIKLKIQEIINAYTQETIDQGFHSDFILS